MPRETLRTAAARNAPGVKHLEREPEKSLREQIAEAIRDWSYRRGYRAGENPFATQSTRAALEDLADDVEFPTVGLFAFLEDR